MRDWLRQSLLHSFSLYLLAGFYQGIIIPKSLVQLLWIGLVFTLLNLLVKPVIKLVLLPFNLLAFGLLSWVSQALVLFLAVKIVPGLSVIGFTTPVWHQAGFSIPALEINLLIGYILASILLNLLYKLLDGVLCPY